MFKGKALKKLVYYVRVLERESIARLSKGVYKGLREYVTAGDELEIINIC